MGRDEGRPLAEVRWKAILCGSAYAYARMDMPLLVYMVSRELHAGQSAGGVGGVGAAVGVVLQEVQRLQPSPANLWRQIGRGLGAQGVHRDPGDEVAPGDALVEVPRPVLAPAALEGRRVGDEVDPVLEDGGVLVREGRGLPRRRGRRAAGRPQEGGCDEREDGLFSHRRRESSS